jgi:hypothetical protein
MGPSFQGLKKCLIALLLDTKENKKWQQFLDGIGHLIL